MGELLLFAEPNGVGPLFLQASTTAAYATLTGTPEGMLLWVVSICASAYAEELLYRGYLLTRLTPLLQSAWMAVLVAAMLFGIAHFYQGIQGVLPAWVMGMVYGGLFLRLRTLWPRAIAHAAYNLWATWP
jgi:hypothetical protein